MATALHALSVGSYLQVLDGTTGFLNIGASHCKDNGIDPADVVATRIHPDMYSFHFQVVSVVHHSLGAVKGLLSGEFKPPEGYPDMDYAELQQFVGRAVAELKSLAVESVNDLEGGQVVFKLGTKEIPFTSENFVLSFSLPNLYFHATTAYDILRMLGVPLGKKDFLGRMKIGI